MLTPAAQEPVAVGKLITAEFDVAPPLAEFHTPEPYADTLA